MLDRARLLVYYGLGIAGLRESDVLLASFPKSGNTWIRFFFCNLAGVLHGREKPVGFGELDRVMPELGVSNLLVAWPLEPIPRVVKTHKRRWSIFGGRRSILLTRDPRDVMTSFFYFENAKRRPRTEGSFSEFLRHPRFGLPAWFEHTRSWLDSESVWVTYEELKEDDATAFRKLTDYLEIDVSQEQIAEAAKRASFETVRGLEDKKRHKPEKYKKGYRFTRSGKRGGWKELFGEEDLAYYARLKDEFDLSAY